MKVEVRHVRETHDGDAYRTYAVFTVDSGGREEKIESTDEYPEARRLAKAHALQNQATLFEVDIDGEKREIPLPGPFPSMYTEEAPSPTPEGFSVRERSTGMEIVYPDVPGGFGIPEIMATVVFLLAALGAGYVIYSIAHQTYGTSVWVISLFSGMALFTFNPWNIWTSMQPRKSELHLGSSGILARNFIGKRLVEDKIAWDEVEDVIVEKDIETEMWDVRVLTTDDEFFLWDSDTRPALDWLKQMVCYAARQYHR